MHFKGVSNHGLRTRSYADALLALKAASLTPTGRQRQAKPDGFPLGGHSKSVTWVRERSDGAIAFMLYSTDVVTWFPDNSVEINNWGSSTTSGFASRFLPDSIYLNVAGCTIGYATKPDAYAWDGNICKGRHNVARFREHDGVFLPDEDTLEPMHFPELDLAAAREVTRSLPFKDFEMWLSMAPMHLELEHAGDDVEECLHALRERDFRTAATHLPLMSGKASYGRDPTPLKIRTPHWTEVVTLSSLTRLKLALWAQEGAFTTVTKRTLPRKEFDRRMRRVRDMEKADVRDAYRYGP